MNELAGNFNRTPIDGVTITKGTHCISLSFVFNSNTLREQPLWIFLILLFLWIFPINIDFLVLNTTQKWCYSHKNLNYVLLLNFSNWVLIISCSEIKLTLVQIPIRFWKFPSTLFVSKTHLKVIDVFFCEIKFLMMWKPSKLKIKLVSVQFVWLVTCSLFNSWNYAVTNGAIPIVIKNRFFVELYRC